MTYQEYCNFLLEKLKVAEELALISQPALHSYNSWQVDQAQRQAPKEDLRGYQADAVSVGSYGAKTLQERNRSPQKNSTPPRQRENSQDWTRSEGGRKEESGKGRRNRSQTWPKPTLQAEVEKPTASGRGRAAADPPPHT